MSTHRLAASFWRGGTSRGLIIRAKDIGGFSPASRERMILQAMGSPDPDGRQIDGLGGGVSSLSKACIIGAPNEAAAEQERYGKLPGVSWADERGTEYDIVYRFAQVAIREASLSWGATCGNMLSAVACAAISDQILPYSKLFMLARSQTSIDSDQPVPIPLRILSANSGEVLHARVLVDRQTLELYEPSEGQGVSIAGVPGMAPPVELEFPISGSVSAARDCIDFDGRSVTYQISDAGLPNIILQPSAVGLSDDLLNRAAADLDAMRDVHETLERLRVAVSAKHSLDCTPPSPKICLVGRSDEPDADVVVRAISTGDFHRTVPGTTLSALALASTVDGSMIAELFSRPRDGLLRARHPAGVAEARVRSDESGRAICLQRTARKIMEGVVLVKP